MAEDKNHPLVGTVLRTGIGLRQNVEVVVTAVDVPNNWVWYKEARGLSTPNAKRPHEFLPVVKLDA